MVIDASAAVELLLGGARGQEVADALGAAGGSPTLHAPDLLDLEVAQAFRRLVTGGVVSDPRATGSIRLLDRLPIRRHPAQAVLPRVWALRHNLSAYDAAYVALAEALACPLMTCDARLAGAPGHGAVVRVVGVPPPTG